MVVVSAPSGAGKTTIVRELINSDLNLHFSISACSRKPRGNEKNGEDYYFISVADFKQKIDNDEFVEWEEVYPGHFYGTLRSEVERLRQQGKHIIFDVDVKGGLNIKSQFQSQCLSVFIKPPSIDELEKRLKSRSTDDGKAIAKRLAKAEFEMLFADQFDRVIVNDELKTAIAETYQIVSRFLSQ